MSAGDEAQKALGTFPCPGTSARRCGHAEARHAALGCNDCECMHSNHYIARYRLEAEVARLRKALAAGEKP